MNAKKQMLTGIMEQFQSNILIIVLSKIKLQTVQVNDQVIDLSCLSLCLLYRSDCTYNKILSPWLGTYARNEDLEGTSEP